jgi:hypothetical protein
LFDSYDSLLSHFSFDTWSPLAPYSNPLSRRRFLGSRRHIRPLYTPAVCSAIVAGRTVLHRHRILHAHFLLSHNLEEKNIRTPNDPFVSVLLSGYRSTHSFIHQVDLIISIML